MYLMCIENLFINDIKFKLLLRMINFIKGFYKIFRIFFEKFILVL